ncbi:MAG: hypothetical protein BMS9Abin12_1884 [Acidimicrobiia bacterium]|nr:MAG: hypothetical protein BMS9Abin12_1884 [Acidimicrobiia bacterium]
MATRRIMIAIVAAIALLGAACTSGAAESTTTSSTTSIPAEIPDLEFGSGEVPFTVPAGFPIPEAAVVGSTMIDGVNGRTEMIINFAASVADVVAFYEANLPALGFEVLNSKGTASAWDISISKDGITGRILLTFGATGLTSGTFSFDHP